MTCIAGVVHEGKVHLGGDSAGVGSDWSLTIRRDEKLFTRDPYVLGFAGSFRMGQLVRYSFDPPVPHRADLPRFMATEFITALRTCLTDGGWTANADDDDGLLVGVAGRLFSIPIPDLQVGESRDGYDAIGSGADLARGALYSTRGAVLGPEYRLRVALEAAEHGCAGVRQPFVYVTGGCA